MSVSCLKWGELAPAVSWHYRRLSPAATGGYAMHLLFPTEGGATDRDTESVNSFGKISMLISHVPTSEGLCESMWNGEFAQEIPLMALLSHASWLQLLLPVLFLQLAKTLWRRWTDHHEWPTGTSSELREPCAFPMHREGGRESTAWDEGAGGLLRASLDHLSVALLLGSCLISVNRKRACN